MIHLFLSFFLLCNTTLGYDTNTLDVEAHASQEGKIAGLLREYPKNQPHTIQDRIFACKNPAFNRDEHLRAVSSFMETYKDKTCYEDVLKTIETMLTDQKLPQLIQGLSILDKYIKINKKAEERFFLNWGKIMECSTHYPPYILQEIKDSLFKYSSAKGQECKLQTIADTIDTDCCQFKTIFYLDNIFLTIGVAASAGLIGLLGFGCMDMYDIFMYFF